MIIQIIGLPGAGKTALSEALADRINAIHWNADKVRATLNSDLGFTKEDRLEQSRRMGCLARLTSEQDHIVIADFVCPTDETREAFGKPDILIWVNRIDSSRFEDTNKMWENPNEFDLVIKDGLTVEEEVDLVINTFNLYDWKKPTTLLLGRYQPWHEGHDALYDEAITRTGQNVIGVRHTQGTSEKDPMIFTDVKKNIAKFRDNAFVVKFPNITNIVYGRDVGYKIEQVELSKELQDISATNKRKEMGL
jgi:hypothetical protein